MSLPIKPLPQSCRWLRWPAGLLLLVLVGGVGLFAVGDFGLTQKALNVMESRALAGKSTRADKWTLRLFYGTLQLGGQVVYPQAAQLLDYYCAGSGDTLRFDAKPLLRHPEVQQALRQRKPGITFRHQAVARPFYIARQTDWSLFYAFDLLYIRRTADQVVFYDNYFFQPLARRSYTPFHFGRLRCKLNDGLIQVAYPKSKPFVAFAKVAISREFH